MHGRYADITLKRGVVASELERAFYDGRILTDVVLTSEQNGRTATYKLERAIVKSWSTSGDTVMVTLEEVAARAAAKKARPSETVSLNFR
ncbi:MAG: hypothetical protein R3C58_04080 [Parvularculaceae bacterium]